MILKSTLITLALPLLISCTLLSCSKKEAEKQDVDTPVVQVEDTVYSDWLAYTYQNIKIIYPENHTLADDLYPMAMGYIKSSKQICNFLRIPVPEDTLRIYFYTGFGQGREMTGNEWPSVDGNNLHFWLPGFMGTTLTQYLLPKWHPEKPRYRFLKEGLMTLFDYSGQDYHEYTLNFIDEDRLVPLLELARDTAINAYKGSYPVAEAASFVAFFVDRYGIEGLNALYMSQEPFEVAVSKLFKTDVEAMQKEWLEYADRVYYESLRGK